MKNSMHLENTVALLARTPATLDALLRDLPDAWTHCNEGGDTWSAYDVIGHLIHIDRANWMARITTILESGESRPFEPADRWAQTRESRDKSLAQLLDEFALVRSQNLQALHAFHLRPEQLSLRGRHPSLGAVTLSQALASWAAHDLTHLHQVSRILAYQYRDAVGPWRQYLGVLQCAGHSAP